VSAQERSRAAAEGPPVELTLDAFVQAVIRTNPAVEEARLKLLVSKSQEKAQWGDFEPALVGRYRHDKLERENNALQIVSQLGQTDYWEENREYSAGIEGKLPTGATYRVGASTKKTESKYTEDGEFESFVGVSAAQPLLRGATRKTPTAAIRAARQARYVAFHEYRRSLMETVATAESAYWNLVFAQERRKSAAESVTIAEGLAADARERVATGKLAELDLQEAETELAIRRSRLGDAEQAVTDASTQLKLMLSDSAIGAGKSVVALDPIAPGTPLAQGAEQELEGSIAWAMRAQPAYMIQIEDLARQRILLDYSRDRQLPELNLSGSIGYKGLADQIDDSLGKVGEGDFPSWDFGLELKVPLLSGVRERHELQAAMLQTALASRKVQAAEHEIRSTVRALVSRIETLGSRLASAGGVVALRRTLLEVARSRMQEGRAEIRQVYDAEEKLMDARDQQLEAMVLLREAMTALAFTRGSVLRDRGLERLEGEQVVLAEGVLFAEK
jgi:outer membrane protein TolC